MHTVEGKKREKLLQIKREGSIKGIGGLCKKNINSYSPSKVTNEWCNIPFEGYIITGKQLKTATPNLVV